MTIVNFTPYSSLIGGALIGMAAGLFVLVMGRILGISGAFAGVILPQRGDFARPAALLAGLVVAPLLYRAFGGALPPVEITDSPVLLIAAGLLVGLGTRIGSGCTSGHGVCGLARLSPRSIVATATFLVAAVATVFVMRHVIGA